MSKISDGLDEGWTFCLLFSISSCLKLPCLIPWYLCLKGNIILNSGQEQRKGVSLCCCHRHLLSQICFLWLLLLSHSLPMLLAMWKATGWFRERMDWSYFTQVTHIWFDLLELILISPLTHLSIPFIFSFVSSSYSLVIDWDRPIFAICNQAQREVKGHVIIIPTGSLHQGMTGCVLMQVSDEKCVCSLSRLVLRFHILVLLSSSRIIFHCHFHHPSIITFFPSRRNTSFSSFIFPSLFLNSISLLLLTDQFFTFFVPPSSLILWRHSKTWNFLRFSFLSFYSSWSLGMIPRLHFLNSLNDGKRKEQRCVK